MPSASAVPHPRAGLVLVGLLFAASAGCDGDSGAATAADVAAYCDAYCGWRDRCNKPQADCRPTCEAEGQQSMFTYKASFIQDIGTCFQSSTNCGSDDACYNSAVLKAAPSYQTDPAFTRCMQAHEACSIADKPSFSDDYCPSLLVVIDSVKSSLLDCMDRPCEQIAGCIKGVLGD